MTTLCASKLSFCYLNALADEYKVVWASIQALLLVAKAVDWVV